VFLPAVKAEQSPTAHSSVLHVRTGQGDCSDPSQQSAQPDSSSSTPYDGMCRVTQHHMTSWPQPVLYWNALPARCDAVRFGGQAPFWSKLPPPYLDQQSSTVNYTASRPRSMYHQNLTSRNTPRTYVSNRYRAHNHNQGCTNSCTLSPSVCGSLRMEPARYNKPLWRLELRWP
jgi:hypothetical protein